MILNKRMFALRIKHILYCMINQINYLISNKYKDIMNILNYKTKVKIKLINLNY